MNATMAALRNVNVAAVGLGDYGRQAIISNARSIAGASSTAPRNTAHTGDGGTDAVAARQYAGG